MAYKISEIEGIGPKYTEKLTAAGVNTTEDLLEKCCAPTGRKNMATETGFDEKTLLKWTNMADLMRINGVGEEYSELLEAAGVDTVKELRNRNAENLATAMKEVNDTKKLARTTPSSTVVEKWVTEAKTLDPKITY